MDEPTGEIAACLRDGLIEYEEGFNGYYVCHKAELPKEIQFGRWALGKSRLAGAWFTITTKKYAGMVKGGYRIIDRRPDKEAVLEMLSHDD